MQNKRNKQYFSQYFYFEKFNYRKFTGVDLCPYNLHLHYLVKVQQSLIFGHICFLSPSLHMCMCVCLYVYVTTHTLTHIYKYMHILFYKSSESYSKTFHLQLFSTFLIGLKSFSHIITITNDPLGNLTLIH